MVLYSFSDYFHSVVSILCVATITFSKTDFFVQNDLFSYIFFVLLNK